MERERATVHGLLVWALSVLLAGAFFAAGVPKIAGSQTLGLQAAAMQGFPAWLRIVVGVVEVAGAVGLLVPGMAVYAAIGLAFLMIPASITQYVSGEPGVYVPLFLLALLLLVAWRRDPVTARRIYRSIAAAPHPIVREGAIAGITGATCVAVWFFIVDLIAGHPLFTPTTLGRALFTVLGRVPEAAWPAVYVLGYTVFHYAAFIGVGIVAASVVAWASREPAILLGFAILFVAFEVGFYGFVALLQHASPLGELAWYQVMIGNLIAAIAMGLVIWRAHPRLHYQFAHALD
jgi:uncharacterized membrane protein YphA (DoxX/SURF4 family)